MAQSWRAKNEGIREIKKPRTSLWEIAKAEIMRGNARAAGKRPNGLHWQRKSRGSSRLLPMSQKKQLHSLRRSRPYGGEG